VTRFDDDGLEPPGWVNGGASPPDAAASSPSSAPRRGASTSRRSRPTPVPAATSARTATREPQRRRGRDDEFWGKRFDDDVQPPRPDGTRRQRVARRAAERGDRKRRRRRTLLALAIVLLPIVLVLAASGWFLYELHPPGGPGKRIAVDVPRGADNGKVGDLLQNKGVIGSSEAFQIYTTVTRAGPFTGGRYTMRQNIGVRDAVNVLKAGPAKKADLTLLLPPGLTLSQVADRVGMLPGHSRDAFLALAQSGAVRSKYEPPEVNSLEGLLYPDTYFVSKGESDQEILARLASAFDQKADAAGLSAPNPAGLTPYQTIVAASLIEREAKLDEDRPLISAVIHNRIAAGMPLQIDATVCYAIGGCQRSPSSSDLAVDSPYNTYKVQGLPPTPISSVTTKSLRAAQGPASVPYLYYVLSDKSGKHAFATTPEEHDQQVQEARQKGLL
jgi:UPF0755 protein